MNGCIVGRPIRRAARAAFEPDRASTLDVDAATPTRRPAFRPSSTRGPQETQRRVGRGPGGQDEVFPADASLDT
jgi:hypothetical protein